MNVNRLFSRCLIHTSTARCLHTSTAMLTRTRTTPLKTPSIKDSALKLGFTTAKEMYPVYPLEEPPKLWMITQIKSLKHNPYWVKEAMKEMGLYRIYDVSIQINAPEINEVLWSVKHLVKIQPVMFPDGEPTSDDIGSTQLTNDGKFIIYKELTPQQVDDVDKVPTPQLTDWPQVDGYRMCNNCNNRRCKKYGMCQKLWRQKGKNNIEYIAPKMFNYVTKNNTSSS